MGEGDSFSDDLAGTERRPDPSEEILCRIDLLKSLQASFVCRRCGECCKQEAIAFTEKDVLRASHKVQLSPIEFINRYELTLVNNPGFLEFYRLPSGKFGVCPFYSDHTCTIHDARPDVCRGFPFLTPENVHNAFKMNNVIKIGAQCKVALEQVKRIYSETIQIVGEAKNLE
jgi:Fe-S-cluster containining protein